jgi:CheY-like chemotaxis protein
MTKILLVEDDKSLREIYGVRLLAEGYDIISAGDGEAALAMAIKDRPALIVSDVMMPKISGFDMLDILRSTTETRNIKVIMMTALSSDDQRKRGEDLGADKYLVKSQVGIEDVVRAVHEVLGDAPTSATIGGTQASSTTTPSAPAPTPSSSPAPRPAPAVTPAPRPDIAATSAPSAPSPAPQPATPVTPAPTLTPAPSVSTDDSDDSSLPQPTAPFSTARTGGLADRVIHPIERNDPSPTVIADQIDKELGGGESTDEPAPASPSESAPNPSEPESSTTPSSDSEQATPPVSYEETPRTEQSAS